MIDARVDDAVRRHLQKMDWLHGEAGAKSTASPSAGPVDSSNIGSTSMGATTASWVLNPVLDMDSRPETPVKREELKLEVPLPAESAPPSSDSTTLPAEEGTFPAKGEGVEAVVTPWGGGVEGVAQTDAAPSSEGGTETPPKDGTQV